MSRQWESAANIKKASSTPSFIMHEGRIYVHSLRRTLEGTLEGSRFVELFVCNQHSTTAQHNQTPKVQSNRGCECSQRFHRAPPVCLQCIGSQNDASSVKLPYHCTAQTGEQPSGWKNANPPHFTPSLLHRAAPIYKPSHHSTT